MNKKLKINRNPILSFFKIKNTFMLTFSVVCCSYQPDCYIRVCISHQSDHCVRVWLYLNCTNQVTAGLFTDLSLACFTEGLILSHRERNAHDIMLVIRAFSQANIIYFAAVVWFCNTAQRGRGKRMWCMPRPNNGRKGDYSKCSTDAIYFCLQLYRNQWQ